MAFVNPLKYDGQKHTPFVAGDQLNPALIPVSARSANQLQVLGDGLYIGNVLTAPTFYVAAAGSDVPDNGVTKAAPFKTLAYALSRISAQSVGGVFAGKAVIALKAGESFLMTSDFVNNGDLEVAFYDSIFGDYNSVAVNGARPAIINELNRPIIVGGNGFENSLWRSYGFRQSGRSRLKLTGLYVNLSNQPSGDPDISTYGGFSDFVTTVGEGEATFSTEGCIINGHNGGVFGLLGMHARSETRFTAFATQMLIDGGKVVAGSQPFVLSARNSMLKFYNDFPGSAQTSLTLAPTSANSSSGTGLLHLFWSETQAQLIQAGANSLDTYPPLFDPTIGMRNYFTGMTRTQQQNPLNVISGRAF